MTFDRAAGQVTARLDGPHCDQDTAAAASLAGEVVRFLNYATGSHAAAGLTLPGTAHTVLGELALAVSHLGQLTAQVNCFLDRELTAGRLGHDHGADPALPVECARGHLLAAASAAAVLAPALGAAQADIAYLHHRKGATR